MPKDDSPKPLLWFHRGSKQWTKKIRGRFRYFGVEYEAAVAKYLAEKADWYDDKNPREPVTAGNLNVDQLVNLFLESQERKLDINQIRLRTFQEYRKVCAIIKDEFGAQRLVATLTQPDFSRLKSRLAETNAPRTLTKLVRKCRTPFLMAYEESWIENPVRFGSDFTGTSKRAIRESLANKSSNLYTPEELRTIIDAAGVPMRAFVLLGLNCGFGASDCSSMTIDTAMECESGWITHARTKTSTFRKAPLWVETQAAIREALQSRPPHKRPEDADLAFLTRFGLPWCRINKDGHPNDELGKQFTKLLRKLNLKRPGISFYALRHCFRNSADEVQDDKATNLIMGHVKDDKDMSLSYVEKIAEYRLRAVTDHVYRWLFEK